MFLSDFFPNSWFNASFFAKYGGRGGAGSKVGGRPIPSYSWIIPYLIQRERSLLEVQQINEIQQRMSLAAQLRRLEYEATQAMHRRTLEAAAFTVLFAET